MEILGVGGAEFIAILIIMLVVAGPKRMIQWAYILGQYTAKARALWAESMSYIQKEFDEAGVNIELPKEPPSRRSLNRQINQQMNKALEPMTKPVKEAMDETKSEINYLKRQTAVEEKPVTTVKPSSKPDTVSNGNGTVDSTAKNLGTWSGGGSDSE